MVAKVEIVTTARHCDQMFYLKEAEKSECNRSTVATHCKICSSDFGHNRYWLSKESLQTQGAGGITTVEAHDGLRTLLHKPQEHFLKQPTRDA